MDRTQGSAEDLSSTLSVDSSCDLALRISFKQGEWESYNQGHFHLLWIARTHFRKKFHVKKHFKKVAFAKEDTLAQPV